MIQSVKITDCFVDFACDYILQVSRRKYGGISMLCQIMPNALPIAREYTSFSVNDCVVTGIQQRPCFEIMSGKHGDTCSFVHHSLIQCCQSIWTILHLVDVLACTISIFKNQHSENTLSTLTELFDACAQRKQVVDYLAFVMGDVETIFSEDNIIQPRKDEFLFVQCSGSSNTLRPGNSEASPESDADDADDADDAQVAHGAHVVHDVDLDDRDEDEGYSRGGKNNTADKAIALPLDATGPNLMLCKKRKQPREKQVCNAVKNPALSAKKRRHPKIAKSSTTHCTAADKEQASNAKKMTVPTKKQQGLNAISSEQQIHAVQGEYHVLTHHTASKKCHQAHNNLSRIHPTTSSQSMPTTSQASVVGIKNALALKIPQVFEETHGQGDCCAVVVKKTKKKKIKQMLLVHTGTDDLQMPHNLDAPLPNPPEPTNTGLGLSKADKKSKKHLQERTSEKSKSVETHCTHAHEPDKLIEVIPVHKQCTNIKKKQKISGDMASTEASSTAASANSSKKIQKKMFIPEGFFAPAPPKNLVSTETMHSTEKPFEKTQAHVRGAVDP